MLKSSIFLGVTFAEVLVLLLLALNQFNLHGPEQQIELERRRELVRSLKLTDFSIWTEARYTRHPSQTDFFSPFQDFPSSLEHFPAGSVIAPVYSLSESGNHD